MKNYFYKSLLAPALCISLSCGGILPQALAQTTPASIAIVIVQGEGAVTSIRQHVSSDPVVMIEDDDHKPINGAVVTFALPVSGASGEFGNGAKTQTAVTDKNGLATAHGMKVNEVPGKVQIYVTASYRGQRARGVINQMIEAPPGAKTPVVEHTAHSGGSWKWILLGVVAAGGAGAGYYFATRSNSPASPVSISAGSAVFGSPR